MCDDNLVTIRKTGSTATTVRHENSNHLINAPFYPIIHSNWNNRHAVNNLDKTSHGLLVINPTCTCLPFTILTLRINLCYNRCYRCTYVCIIVRNRKVLQ